MSVNLEGLSGMFGILKSGTHESVQLLGNYFGPIKDVCSSVIDKITALVSTLFDKIFQLFSFHIGLIKDRSPNSFGEGVSNCPVIRAKALVSAALNKA